MVTRFTEDRAYQAYRLLQVVFIIAPIIAGLDKFFYFLTNWSQYLSPMAMEVLGGQQRIFMILVGIIEVVVGIGMIFKPLVFAYFAGIWLICIIINLLLTGTYFDIALRDLGLALSAFALARLSYIYNSNK